MEPPPVEPMFDGQFRHTMDAKNRVTIPAIWRGGKIDEFFSIANVKHRFLMVLPLGAIRKVQERVEGNSGLSPQARQTFLRQFNSRAQRLVIDKAGRMLIPAEQCSRLQLCGEVVLVGNGQRIEVWNPEQWAEWEKASEEGGPTFDEVCDNLGS